MSNVSTMPTVEESEGLGHIETRILETLAIYPRLSPTMLQAGLGPALSPKLWRPALDRLIEMGLVSINAEFPPSGSERTRPFTVIEPVKRDISNIKVPPAPNRAA